MLVFLGDSITQWWDTDCYNHFFQMYEPVNLGISGHTSKDTLEYIELSHFNNLNPSVTMLHIGTNDADHDMTTGETAQTIQNICKTILEIYPDTMILLVGPLPRGETSSDRHRNYNNEVNKKLKSMTFDPRVHYINIDYLFTRSDGSISKHIMYDYLHLTKPGYKIFTEAISEFLMVLLCSPSSSLSLQLPTPS
jgi:lysophospholipase L1-like esterase